MSKETLILDNDGRYQKAIIFDKKGYVLLGYDGKLTIKGNTLKSRKNEPFLNKFLSDSVQYFFDGEIERVKEDYDQLYDLIERKQLQAQDVAKREYIGMSLESYKNKISAGQNKIAVYELALSGNRDYGKGDVISSWMSEPDPILKEYKTKEDEWVIPKNASSYDTARLIDDFDGNIYRHFYQKRLDKTVKKLLVVFGLDRFNVYFPNISILKEDKRKMISVLGLNKFHERYPDYGWTNNCYSKLNEKDKILFLEYIKKEKISNQYLDLTN